MTENLMSGIWIGAAALFGLLAGSFLNVCIYRLPAGLTIVRGHSFCPQCRHPLRGLDLVPVLSYLFLGRRCRYCHQPIPSRYAKVELLTAVYFALTACFIRPAQFAWPAWLLTLLPAASAGAQPAGNLAAGLLLAAASALAFSGFLVWSLIIWDGHAVPAGLYLFTAIPVLLRLALQPERLAGQLAALLLSLLIFLLLRWLQLFPEMSGRQERQLAAGLGLLGLMAGLRAIQPALGVLLVELLVLSLRGRKLQPAQRGRPVAQADATIDRTDQLWRSLPLQITLIGSVSWLLL
jgi:prepilin signal peptidase PulO-like enzyme (type II secretory pathway)